MKEEIQDCFLENRRLFAKRSLSQRVQSGWEGTWLEAGSHNRLLHNRLLRRWENLKYRGCSEGNKRMKRFRGDEEGHFSQAWWLIRNGAWRRTESWMNFQAADLGDWVDDDDGILPWFSESNLSPLPFPKLTEFVISSKLLHTALPFPAVAFSSPCSLFNETLNF